MLGPVYVLGANSRWSQQSTYKKWKHGPTSYFGSNENTGNWVHDIANCHFADVFQATSVTYNYCVTPYDYVGSRKLCLPWPLHTQCVSFVWNSGSEAQAFGDSIYFSECDPGHVKWNTVLHEMVHVRQFVQQGKSLEKMGYEYMRAWCFAGFSYENHPLEKEAEAFPNSLANGERDCSCDKTKIRESDEALSTLGVGDVDTHGSRLALCTFC